MPDVLFRSTAGKRHGIAEHGQQQFFGGMSTDNFAPEAGFDQFRHAANMVDVGVGQEQIVDFVGWYGKLGERQFRIVALGASTVHHDIDAVGRAGMGFDKMAGAGDTVFCAEMMNFHGIDVQDNFFSLILKDLPWLFLNLMPKEVRIILYNNLFKVKQLTLSRPRSK